MKKIVSFAFFLFLQFYFCTNTLAYDFEIGNFRYTITSANNRTVSVEAASKNLQGEIVIPSTVTYNDVDFTVTAISTDGFAYCYYITSLTIPSSVTKSTGLGFGWMQHLETLIFDNPQPNSFLPYTLFEYDWRAFKTVKIINSDVKDKLNQGLGVMNLLPSHELYINDSLVEDYIVPDGTENIGAVFANCNSLKSIYMPNSVKTIVPQAFNKCTSLSTVTLSSGLNDIGNEAFTGCSELRTIYVKSATPPSTNVNSFPNGAYMFANVYVPKGTLSDYKNALNWKNFANIIEKEYDDVTVPTKEKCSVPVISYHNGEIHFNCETEEVEFVSSISNSDVGSYATKSINISATYNISVYATKAGYDNSETATATLCWIDVEPKTEGISNGVTEVRARAALIKSAGGQLTIEGIDDGQLVELYSLNGEKRGSAVSKNGAARIDTNVHTGSVVVVKMGEKSVKVIVK